MVLTVATGVRNNAETAVSVITWLVSVTKDVMLGGQEHCVNKVICIPGFFFFLFCNVFCWFCFYGLLQIRIDIIDIFVKWNQIILLVQGIGNKIFIFFYNSINWKTNMYKSNNHISLHKNGHSLLVTRRSW